jgi:hypothetical protein
MYIRKLQESEAWNCLYFVLVITPLTQSNLFVGTYSKITTPLTSYTRTNTVGGGMQQNVDDNFSII